MKSRKVFLHFILFFLFFSTIAYSSSEERFSLARLGETAISDDSNLFFNYSFDKSELLKLQVVENCITVYFSAKSREFERSTDCCFGCSCFRIILRSDDDHCGLHSDLSELEIPHYHVQHTTVDSISLKELRFFLDSLIKHKLIKGSERDKCLSSFRDERGK